MKLEKMHFKGELKEIDKVRKDLKALPENFINEDISVECIGLFKKVFISPRNNDTKLKIIPCKKLKNIEIFLTENKTKFDYNQRRYYVYASQKSVMFSDEDLIEKTPFYNPSE